jgi:hypothetical protein
MADDRQRPQPMVTPAPATLLNAVASAAWLAAEGQKALRPEAKDGQVNKGGTDEAGE